MQAPKVSVILTSRNGNSTIRRAVESVQRQVFTYWELIVFDDGSAELLAQSLPQDERIHSTRSDVSLGRQGALNAACVLVAGKYMAIIDDDDEWVDATKLAQQVAFLDSHPDVGVVGTWANVVGVGGGHIATLRPAIFDTAIRRKILSENQFINSSVLFRRDIFVQLNGYHDDTTRRYTEDYDFWLRLGTVAKFANVPAAMVAWQSSPSSYTAGKRKAQVAAHLQLIKMYGSMYPRRVSAYCATLARYMITILTQ